MKIFAGQLVMSPVDQVNNKTILLKELDIMKRKTPETTKAYWMGNNGQHLKGDVQVRVRARSLILVYTKKFDRQQPELKTRIKTKTTLFHSSILSHGKMDAKHHPHRRVTFLMMQRLTQVTFLYELTGEVRESRKDTRLLS